MNKKINIVVIAIILMFSSSVFSQEEKTEPEKKPNIYDLIITGKFRDAEKICPDGNLKDALKGLLSLKGRLKHYSSVSNW